MFILTNAGLNCNDPSVKIDVGEEKSDDAYWMAVLRNMRFPLGVIFSPPASVR